MKFILHVTLWGEHCTDVFLNYALPSLLRDMTLDNYNQEYEFQFNIFTFPFQYFLKQLYVKVL